MLAPGSKNICRPWLGLLFLSCAAIASERDPFMQVDLSHPYRRLWSPKLEVTRFDCGRFVVLPAFEPGYSVSIYSNRDSGAEANYRITYVSLKENLWQVSDGLRDTKKATDVKTSRIDADIPRSTAKLLGRVWLRILGRKHPQQSAAPSDGYILLDSPYMEWSLQRANAFPMRAQANFYIRASPSLKLLADLSDVVLPKYIKASSRQRPAIIREIEDKAKKLLEMDP